MTIYFEKSTRSLLSVFGLFFALFIVSCEDDHDHDEEHTDAEGFILETSSGTEMYREFKGTQTGSVTLSAGDTLELSVHFLDDNGKEMEHDEHEGGEEEEEGELEVSGFNSIVALVQVEEEHDDHGDEEEHEMGLEIIGVSIGSTSFKLELMHDGHGDYTSTNNIPIVVK